MKTPALKLSLVGGLLAVLAPFSRAQVDADQLWAQYRGPEGKGIALPSDQLPPLEWSEKKNVLWKEPLPGKAWSSPILQSGKVWCANATEDGKVLSVAAFDLQTGKKVVDRVLFEIARPQFNIAYNSYASSTPAAGKGKVYLHYGSPGTACLDGKTGATIWSRQDLPCHHWRGSGASPLLYKDRLYLTFDGFDYQYVACLDANTGKTIWRTDRNIRYDVDFGDYKKAYGSPAIRMVGNKPQLICPAACETQSFDPDTGALLWSVHHGGMNAASVVQSDGTRLILHSGDGGFSLHGVDPGSDPHGDITPKVVWKSNRGVPSYASVLVRDGKLFFARDKDSGGTATCLDSATGAPIWQERLGGSKVHASPVMIGDRIYLFDDSGQGFVIAASDKFRKLGGGKLDEGCMASPAVAGDKILLRTKGHLYCIAPTNAN